LPNSPRLSLASATITGHSSTAAIAACKRQKARLVIAKLDRLSRNLAFIAALMESGVEFVAVDNPHMNKLTIHILAAVAEHEREMISERTKAALQAAKARGERNVRTARGGVWTHVQVGAILHPFVASAGA
jgi:DNA invertase Pin-like site-specific DNA recombinase